MISGVLVLLALLLAAPGAVTALGPGANQFGTPEPVPPADAQAAPTPTGILEEIIVSRTPEPTITPGVLQQEVEKLVTRAGLARTQVLGLTVTEWISLAGSLLLVLAGYLIGTWLIRRFLRRIVRRTPTEFDDRLLEAVGGDVRWLVVFLTLYFATVRLTFVSAGLKTLLKDAYFVVALFLAARIVFRLIDLADGWARERSRAVGREGELEPLIVLLSRLGRVILVLLGLSILLS
jgi:hypothetical protein